MTKLIKLCKWKNQVSEWFVFRLRVFSEPHHKMKANRTHTTSRDGLGSVYFKGV